MMYKKQIIILLLLCQYAEAQHVKFKMPDSLSNKGYGYFSSHISLNHADSLRSYIYAQSWLLKSKQENNCEQLGYAYKAVLYTVAKKWHLNYADSIVQAAKRCGRDSLLGAAYMTRGVVYYDRKEIIKALDDYLIADEFASRTNDAYLIHKVKFGIGITKYYLGFYDEALSLFKECRVYFEEENDRAYLNTLHLLGLCNNKLGNYDMCSTLNHQGIAAGRDLGNLEMEPYFIHSEGINQYFKGNYLQSIKLLNDALPAITKSKDFANESVANFYLGKNYWALKQQAKALPYFQKVDAAFLKKNYIRPDLRENYELLLDYYKTRGDKTSQLLYIDRLFKVDSILNKNYKYLSTKIFKQYDTRKLLLAKEEIEQSMETRKIIDFTIILLLVVTIIFLGWRHFINKKRYRLKYEQLMNRKPEKLPVVLTTEKETDSDLNPELVKTILKNLDKFESGKKYLEKDMNLVRIAELLHTNTKYVTKIIQRYRGKGTIEYISDLKIDHIVELLKTENRYRNYTNKALGDEAGFGSTQNFTRAFKARNEISPTYFIKELKKDLRE